MPKTYGYKAFSVHLFLFIFFDYRFISQFLFLECSLRNKGKLNIIPKEINDNKSKIKVLSVTLRKRKNSEGTITLRLDIYNKGQRTYETLKHLQLAKPSNLKDRAANKEKLEKAETLVVERAKQLQDSDYDMTSEAGNNTIVTEWMQRLHCHYGFS